MTGEIAEFRVTHALPEPGSGPVTVGWLLREERGAALYEAPRRVRSAPMSRTHAKSASRCPAILNLESRHVEVACPFDLPLGFVRDSEGRAGLRNLAGASSPVRASRLADIVHLVNEAEWRHPDRPTVQMSLPYVFVSDEPVYLSQFPPFQHYRSDPWPGTLFGGRFPIDVWPRPLMWAFEWHDVEKPLRLSRGEPLFWCQFETVPPDRPFRLVEAARTPELEAWLEGMAGVVNHVNRTFSLFRTARERRPAVLVRPRER